MGKGIIHELQAVNKELWLLFSMFAILGLLNFLVVSDHVLLGLYTLPVLFSAYHYGRRHATLTAVGAMCLVVLVTRYNGSLFNQRGQLPVAGENWFEIGAWGGTLMVMAYAMGTLYERMRSGMEELRQTYHGVLMILRHFISKDKYTENHCYRVSVYATKIAAYLGLRPQQIEDIRSAALLHDIGKLDISRNLLYKAGRLTKEEYADVQEHVGKGVELLEPIGGSLRRVIPIILAHHDKFDGTGYHPTQAEEIPIEARVISVADVYDALTSDRPYRKGMTTFEARDIISKGTGTDFDPQVVTAFLNAFSKRELEVPEVMVA
jgi:putative nucleotidyltransferase with HDIG domain